MTTRYWGPPNPGDIVHCRFPEGAFEDWFAPDLVERFGKHPKRGKLNLENMQNKKKLHAAIIEAKHAGKV